MPLTDNLISYWKLDEASGDAVDAHGSNTLTDHNTVTSGTGKINTARQFTRANSEFLNHTSNSDLQTGDIDFTIAFWINLDSQPGTEVVVMKGDDVGGTHEHGCFQTGSNMKFSVENGSGSATDGTTLSNGTWYFVVVWHDSVNNQVGISVNDNTPTTSAYSGGITAAGSNFEVGGDVNGSRYVDGRIDEMGFWKRVLTSGERTQLYNGGAGLAYPFSASSDKPPRPTISQAPHEYEMFDFEPGLAA